ncbi:outer membrane protein [Consotaella salsifontis]|uniref:Outer membrane immunogenic protein n=1 Tax=Consotaella salsifontis TaxID=1365950 RepID=A0A1T4NMF1_9HYPH|nr:outer membrane beta-barrel protein [Consotaella salsifontis]SJZ80491.1 outer membrane immunogenic protein [Consotaella salsifontis]
MKRIALLLASTAFVTPAFAADIVMQEPPAPAPVYEAAPAYTWTGFYVGGQLGGAFGGDMFDNSGDDASLIGGAHVGYDYQMDNFVFGGVIDISGLDASSRQTFDIDVNGDDVTDGSVSSKTDINFLATARLKAGFAWDRAMIYGTGGLAYANVDTSVGNSLYDAGYRVRGDDDDFGYVVGGGVDFLATKNISVGVEYLYTNLGSNDFDVDAPGVDADFSTSKDLDFHTVWAKASYRFN